VSPLLPVLSTLGAQSLRLCVSSYSNLIAFFLLDRLKMTDFCGQSTSFSSSHLLTDQVEARDKVYKGTLALGCPSGGVFFGVFLFVLSAAVFPYRFPLNSFSCRGPLFAVLGHPCFFFQNPFDRDEFSVRPPLSVNRLVF